MSDHLYNAARWRKRRTYQLREHPLCQRCSDKGLVVPATVAHHIERHNGDPVSFFTGPLRSLCKPCHDRIEQGIEARGFDNEIGLDGWPLDPTHPCYRSS